MMDTAIYIWLYLSLGNLLDWLPTTVWALSLVLVAGALVVWIASTDAAFEKDIAKIKGLQTRFNKYTKLALSMAVASSVLASFYPDKEDLAWIIGGSVTYSVAQSEEAQKLPDNVLRAFNSFLEDIPEDTDERN